MTHKLTLTRKYQIIDRRVDGEETTYELTDDATIKAFNAVNDIACSAIIDCEVVDDIRYEDIIFYLSDEELAELKESVNLEGFEVVKVDD